MNWFWIFITALILIVAIIISVIIGVLIGAASTINRMNSDMKKLMDDYNDAIKNNSKFFKDMADAINKMTG